MRVGFLQVNMNYGHYVVNNNIFVECVPANASEAAASGMRFLTTVGLGLDTVRRKEYMYTDRFIVVHSLLSKSSDLTNFIFAMCTIRSL